MDFPDIKHGCGAGTSFAFLNNKGELYPCDRYRDIVHRELPIERIKLTNRNFYDIWDEEIFAHPFKITMGDNVYQKCVPCNECKYLRVACFPCPVYGMDQNSLKLDNCIKFKQLIEKKAGERVG